MFPMDVVNENMRLCGTLMVNFHRKFSKLDMYIICWN